MRLIEKVWLKWRKIDPDTRRHIKQTTTWVTAYLICCPLMLYVMLMQIYDLQTAAAIRTNVPAQVNDSNYNTWLTKQHQQGRFLEEKKK